MIYGDFETRSHADLIRWGATRYALDPTTQILCFCWTYDEEEEIRLWHRGHHWIEKSPRPDELIERIRDGELFEAHNAYFEFSEWNEVLTREFPEFDVKLKLEQMRCSAAKASCLSLPRALGDAVKSIHMPRELQKDEDGRRLINKLSKPLPAKSAERKLGHDFCEDEMEHKRNWAYCRQDVRAERGLSEWCPDMTETELRYWQMDWRMNGRGITLDLSGAKKALKLANHEANHLNEELAQLTGGEVLKGTSRRPLLNWINQKVHDIGLHTNKVHQELTWKVQDEVGDERIITGCPDCFKRHKSRPECDGHWVGDDAVKDTRADTLSMLLYSVPTKASDEMREARAPEAEERWQSWGEHGKDLRRVLIITMEVNRTSVAKYKQMIDSVTPDGRLHDIMLYNGADRTGRWSGKGVQPHNFVRGYAKDMPTVWEDIHEAWDSEINQGILDAGGDEPLPNTDWIKVCWGEPLPFLAKACRGALTASLGKELLAADFNAIEARKLAWLSGCAPQILLFNTPGGDPYIDMAKAIYKRDDLTKKNKAERQMGKKAILGLGYAMGWEKFQATVYAEEGIWLDDEFCQLVVKIYRKDKCPEVPVLWKACNDAAIEAVNRGRGEFAAGEHLSYFMDGSFLRCRLPSGRLLSYLYPEVHTRVTWRFKAFNEHGKPVTLSFPSKIGVSTWKARHHAEQLAKRQRKTLTDDPPENFLSPHLSFMGRHIITKQWTRIGTHGGSLVENADQASSRDLLAEAMYRVDEIEDLDLLLSIHDEVIAEALIGAYTVKEFEDMMAIVPWWAPGMPIAAEGWVGQRLRK